MSQYFDHVRCPECRTAFDPEKVATRGKQLTCPSCGATLGMADLFGLADHWVGADDEQPDLTLEDAVPKRTEADSEPAESDDRNVPARPVDTAPIGALDILKQMKKDR